MKKLIPLLFTPLLLISLSSCELIIDATLEDSLVDAAARERILDVHVYDMLSGSDIQNALVSVHRTMEEAEANANPVTVRVNTDRSGTATFTGIREGEGFWVRVQSGSSQTCKPTEIIGPGQNYLDVPIM